MTKVYVVYTAEDSDIIAVFDEEHKEQVAAFEAARGFSIVVRELNEPIANPLDEPWWDLLNS